MEDDPGKYRILFEQMAQGAFFQLPDGSLVEVNSAAMEILGVGRETFQGRTSPPPEWKVIRPDGAEVSPEDQPSMVALRTGEPVRNFEAGVYNQRQQRFIWLNINAVPMFRSGEASPYQAFVTLEDISEQKRMNNIHLCRLHLIQFAESHSLEELLVEVLDQLERLTGSSIGFYHFYDAATRQVSLKAWSTQTTQSFCHAENEGHYAVDNAGVWVDGIVGKKTVVHNDYASLPHRRGLPPGHAPVIREIVVPVMRHGEVVALLGIGNKPAPYSEADLSTVSLFADLTWDIAEHKKAETAQLQAERELEVLTSTSMDGYIVTDSRGRILSVNETFCRMYGYTREEMLAKTVVDLQEKEQEAEMIAHGAAIKKVGYSRFETKYLRKDGGVVDVEVSAAYLPESDTFLAFTRDISRQKQMQEDVTTANELLEQRVSQRTAELESAIREQESFSYSVSHDLRAPLRHINSFSAVLLEEHGDTLPFPARHYLERIQAATDHMGSLIDHLLELSRVSRRSIQMRKVSLSEIAARFLRMLKDTEPSRRVELRVESGIMAMGDQHLLSQLLGNLLENAWKYTSYEPLARIEFGLSFVCSEKVYFVKDNGAGFDMAYGKKLFKPFERLHGSEFEGVGIGLATAQRIIERHGGRIWAEGMVGEGATFYFTLPHSHTPGERSPEA